MLPKPSFPPRKSSLTASHSDLTSMTAPVFAQRQLRFSLHKWEVAKLGVGAHEQLVTAHSQELSPRHKSLGQATGFTRVIQRPVGTVVNVNNPHLQSQLRQTLP